MYTYICTSKYNVLLNINDRFQICYIIVIRRCEIHRNICSYSYHCYLSKHRLVLAGESFSRGSTSVKYRSAWESFWCHYNFCEAQLKADNFSSF